MKGSKEIGFTVLSMSTSLIAVFIPILLMGGIVGKLFREFAVTLSVAIAVSLLVSLTTTPMLCAKFLKSKDESRHGPVYRASERAFQWLHNEYASALRWVLRHQGLMLCVVSAPWPEHLPLHHRAQGLLPAAGHRPHGRPNPRRAGHQLRRHERQAAPSWRRWCSTIRPSAR
jgi:hypothetical protein